MSWIGQHGRQRQCRRAERAEQVATGSPLVVLPLRPLGLCLLLHRVQAQHLRELNRAGQHDAVIQLFESDRLAATEEVFGQYVKALAKTDKLNSTALMQTLYRGAQSYMGQQGAAAAAAPSFAARAAAAEGGGGGGFAASALRPQGFSLPGMGGALLEPAALGATAAAGTALGSAKNPIYMMQAEPTFWSQLWRRCAGVRRLWWPICSPLPSASAAACCICRCPRLLLTCLLSLLICCP